LVSEANDQAGDELEIAGDAARSTRSKIFQMLLQIYIMNSLGSSANIKVSSVMAILNDEQLMQDIIPKDDPYYMEMLRNQRAASLRLMQAKQADHQAEEDGDVMTGHLFNHPLL